MKHLAFHNKTKKRSLSKFTINRTRRTEQLIIEIKNNYIVPFDLYDNSDIKFENAKNDEQCEPAVSDKNFKGFVLKEYSKFQNDIDIVKIVTQIRKIESSLESLENFCNSLSSVNDSRVQNNEVNNERTRDLEFSSAKFSRVIGKSNNMISDIHSIVIEENHNDSVALDRDSIEERRRPRRLLNVTPETILISSPYFTVFKLAIKFKKITNNIHIDC